MCTKGDFRMRILIENLWMQVGCGCRVDECMDYSVHTITKHCVGGWETTGWVRV